MSAILSYADDLFSDLLCGEDSGTFSEDLPECSSDIEFLAEFEESIAGLIEDEGKFFPGIDYVKRIQSQSMEACAREDSIAWILKVHLLCILFFSLSRAHFLTYGAFFYINSPKNL